MTEDEQDYIIPGSLADAVNRLSEELASVLQRIDDALPFPLADLVANFHEYKPEHEGRIMARIADNHYPVIPRSYRFFTMTIPKIVNSNYCCFAVADRSGLMQFQKSTTISVSQDGREIFSGSVAEIKSAYDEDDCMTKHVFICTGKGTP